MVAVPEITLLAASRDKPIGNVGLIVMVKLSFSGSLIFNPKFTGVPATAVKFPIAEEGKRFAEETSVIQKPEIFPLSVEAGPTPISIEPSTTFTK